MLNVLPKLIAAPSPVAPLQTCTILSLPPPTYEEHVQSVQNLQREETQFLFNSNQQQRVAFEEFASEGKISTASILDRKSIQVYSIN